MISPQCIPFYQKHNGILQQLGVFFQSAIYIVVQISAYIICNTIDLQTHFLSIMYAKRHSEMMEGSCSKNFDFCPPLKNIYYVAQWAQNLLEPLRQQPKYCTNAKCEISFVLLFSVLQRRTNHKSIQIYLKLDFTIIPPQKNPINKLACKSDKRP